MKFKAYLKQNGEGCDYTIGCGQTVITIEASTIDEAIDNLYEIIKENYRGDNSLKSCELFVINEIINCDLSSWYDRLKFE